MKKASALKLARLAQGMSQADLGKAIGKHQTSVSELERGYRVASARDRKKIAQALGIGVDSLFPLVEASSACISKRVFKLGL
mgnify:CR=1 FL=1